MKKDIFAHEQRYKNWKERIEEEGEDHLTKKNSDILIQFILDMEIGANVSKKNKKGGRSYVRLNSLRQRLSQMLRMLEERNVNDVTKITEKKLIQFFSDMRTGIIKTKHGEKYKSVQDYVKIFKSFYHWWIKVNRKRGKMLLDITEDLDTSLVEAPKFVYITKEQLDKVLPYFSSEEQLILIFCFDTLIRSPTELLSLLTKEIYEQDGKVWVNIPDNISKTFGRKLSLLYCGDELLKYIKEKELNPSDYLFNVNHLLINKKLQKVCVQVFGDKVSDTRAGGLWSDIILYSLRHSGTINLRIIASKNGKISLDTIRQRGGWTDFKMVNYYSRFIGLTGDIEKEDIMISEDKTKLQKEVETLKKQMKAIEQKLVDEMMGSEKEMVVLVDSKRK